MEGLDGLLGLAVLLHPGLATGGFIGVDVFFVLSRFLITRLFLRDLTQVGRSACGASPSDGCSTCIRRTFSPRESALPPPHPT
jgi:peptidoglycan/LPS O-acetylase OafA/YrhL